MCVVYWNRGYLKICYIIVVFLPALLHKSNVKDFANSCNYGDAWKMWAS